MKCKKNTSYRIVKASASVRFDSRQQKRHMLNSNVVAS